MKYCYYVVLSVLPSNTKVLYYDFFEALKFIILCSQYNCIKWNKVIRFHVPNYKTRSVQTTQNNAVRISLRTFI